MYLYLFCLCQCCNVIYFINSTAGPQHAPKPTPANDFLSGAPIQFDLQPIIDDADKKHNLQGPPKLVLNLSTFNHYILIHL